MCAEQGWTEDPFSKPFQGKFLQPLDLDRPRRREVVDPKMDSIMNGRKFLH